MTEEKQKTEEEIKEEEKQERYRKSMIKAHINAYIKRGLNTGIPERYLRIGPEEFKKLLAKNYHGEEGINKVTDFIYKTPLELIKIPFIVIDGGKIQDRKKAAFAIMFRIITCDKFGKFFDCKSLVHKLNTFDAKGTTFGDRRTDLADALKDFNVLCISEFNPATFREKMEGGEFIDEILDHRFNNLNPTIITFQDPINPNNALTDQICGRYLNEMSKQQKLNNNPSEDVLRIQVRSSEDG